MMKKILILIGLILVLIILTAFTQPYRPGAIEAPTTSEPYRATLSGVQTCLPHKDTSGEQTLECAIGLKTDEGDYYSLDLNMMSQEQPSIPGGARITASGLVTPIENLSSDRWQKYNVKGIFSVTDSLEVEGPIVSELQGKWIWKQTLYHGAPKTAPKQADKFTLTIERSKVSGTTDCNGFSGVFVAQNGMIDFGPLAMTKMFCEGSQEMEFIKMIEDAEGYLINPSGDLVLAIKDDGGSVVFEKVE